MIHFTDAKLRFFFLYGLISSLLFGYISVKIGFPAVRKMEWYGRRRCRIFVLLE